MRRSTQFAAAIILTLGTIALAGCATTMTSGSHVQTGLRMAQYHTYDWGPADALPTGDPRLDKDPFFQDHIEGAVEKQLAAKGLVRAEGTPDLLLHYHASIDTRIDVGRTERAYESCQGADCQSWVVDYEAGTLLLDVRVWSRLAKMTKYITPSAALVLGPL
jgi:hypothetical protein